MSTPDGLQRVRHSSALGRWEQVFRRPHARLAPYVRSYEGFDERTPTPLRRVEPASAEIVLILSWGPEVWVGAADGGRGERLASFLVGVQDKPSIVESSGVQQGMQVNLTPLGAHLLTGVSMDELSGRAIATSMVLDRRLRSVADRLADIPSWVERFDLFEDALGARLDDAGPPAPEAAEVWRRLTASGGRLDIARLAGELGWSRQQLHARVRRHLGASPKTLARILRFRRALSLVEHGGQGWAELAVACGYYDQAHFNRDFRAFTGTSPGVYLAARLPDAGGVQATRAGLTSVQDAMARRP